MLDPARRWVREAGSAARTAAPGVKVIERVLGNRRRSWSGSPGTPARWWPPLAVWTALSLIYRVQISERDSMLWRTFDWVMVALEQERLLAERLAGWQDKHPDVEARRVVVRDWPVPRLLEAAKNARLLVVGSRGRSGVRGMLVGSTSQSLLYVAPCPLAIVR